jgi:hypothetical protein
VAAGEEIAATAVVGVVEEEWADAVEDEAVAAARLHRRRDERAKAFVLFSRERSFKRYPVCDTVFYGSIWDTTSFCAFTVRDPILCRKNTHWWRWLAVGCFARGRKRSVSTVAWRAQSFGGRHVVIRIKIRRYSVELNTTSHLPAQIQRIP